MVMCTTMCNRRLERWFWRAYTGTYLILLSNRCVSNGRPWPLEHPPTSSAAPRVSRLCATARLCSRALRRQTAVWASLRVG